MNVHMQINSPELRRQHEEAKARRARLSGEWPPVPKAVLRPIVEKALDPNPVERDWIRIKGDVFVSISSVIELVSRHYKISAAELKGPSRRAGDVRARQVAMYLCRKMTIRSLPEIGRRLGGKDHTTVLHGVRKIEALIEHDTELAAEVEALRARLEASR